MPCALRAHVRLGLAHAGRLLTPATLLLLPLAGISNLHQWVPCVMLEVSWKVQALCTIFECLGGHAACMQGMLFNDASCIDS